MNKQNKRPKTWSLSDKFRELMSVKSVRRRSAVFLPAKCGLLTLLMRLVYPARVPEQKSCLHTLENGRRSKGV